MTNAERVAKMAREITEISEWNHTNLRKESHFNWMSLLLFLIFPITLLLVNYFPEYRV